MNHRIKKLANLASEYADHYDRIGVDRSFQNIFNEKFAMLIVQECIDIISPYTVRMSRPGEEYLHPILEIKQHFGVDK